MKFEIDITHPELTSNIEIESYPDFIMGNANIYLTFPEKNVHCQKEYFWTTVSSMEHELRDLLVIYKGRDASIECKMQKPWIAEASETERKIQETLCGLLSNGMIDEANL